DQLRARQHGPPLQHLRGQRHPGADGRDHHLAVQAGGDGQHPARAHGRCQVSFMSYKFARRSFLRAAGGSAALLAPILRSIESRAQGMTAPLRLLILHHPLGAGPGLATWRPNASATTTSFTLPTESAPFNASAPPLQKYMCMIDGLNLVTSSGQDTHEGGFVAMMTGCNALGKVQNTQQDWAAGAPSIDQLLLDKSPVLGGMASTQKTPFG